MPYLTALLAALLLAIATGSEYWRAMSLGSGVWHQIKAQACYMVEDRGTQWCLVLILAGYEAWFFVCLARLLRQHGKPSPRAQVGGKEQWQRFELLAFLAANALAAYALHYREASQSSATLVLHVGITLALGTRLLADPLAAKPGGEEIRWWLLLFVVVLSLFSQFHPDWSRSSQLYHYRNSIRWTGACRNPNLFGMLMGVGCVLTAGLLLTRLADQGGRMESGAGGGTIQGRLVTGGLCLAGAMTGVGLVRSYSRGAWLGTMVALGFLGYQVVQSCSARDAQRSRGPLGAAPTPGEAGGASGFGDGGGEATGPSRLGPSRKITGAAGSHRLWLEWLSRNWVALAVVLVAGGALLFWTLRPTESPLAQRVISMGNRNDLSWRNRVTAYVGAFQMMADKPWLGFGWNRVELASDSLYQAQRLAEGSAIQLNDYFTLATTLGLPALVCFVGYAGAALRRKVDFLRAVCRAGVLVLLVGFWFDGGLFKLPTAVPFWVLLELGAGPAPAHGGEEPNP